MPALAQTQPHPPPRPPQDFEALTPNLLARTVETVEGGGLVILLLSQLASLTQLYGLAMDAHGRLRTEAHQEVTGAEGLWLGLGVRVKFSGVWRGWGRRAARQGATAAHAPPPPPPPAAAKGLGL